MSPDMQSPAAGLRDRRHEEPLNQADGTFQAQWTARHNLEFLGGPEGGIYDNKRAPSGFSENLANEYLFGEGWGWAARHNAEIWGTGANGMYDAMPSPPAKAAALKQQ
jgi:hypothetical protein